MTTQPGDGLQNDRAMRLDVERFCRKSLLQFPLSPSSRTYNERQSTGDGEQIKRALLDKLSSGSVRAVCASSLHTYRTTTFPETGLAAIPAEEWRHYVAGDSALERGVVTMQWTSQISLPVVGLCPIVATYSGVRLSFEDLAREFPEVPWSRRKALRSTQPGTARAASSIASRPNNVIDLEAEERFRVPVVSRRSAPGQ